MVSQSNNSEPQLVNGDPEPCAGELEPDILEPKREPIDPTRFGDWEKNGRCIDF